MGTTLLIGGEAFPEFPGGLNRYLHDLSGALAAAGVDVPQVVISSAPAPGAVAPGTLPRRLLGIRRAVAGQVGRADVVDAHFPLYAALPLLTGTLRGKPFVVHFHGPWADESAAMGEPGWAVRLKRVVERVVYRRADRVVVLSAAFKQLLVERYRVQPWNVEVIRPAVDLDRFRPAEARQDRTELGLPDEDPVVVAVRRLVPRMGLDMLIRAWSSLDRGTLVIVGHGPERERLGALARDLGIGERVRFSGPVSEARLVQYYRAADLCVLPSLALEGFGLVVLEALACGTPVMASDAGGLPEALAGLRGDLVVPQGDEGALASRLGRVLDDASLLPDPAECRAHAERFSRRRAGRAPPAAVRRRGATRVPPHARELSTWTTAPACRAPSLRW